jgi:hypothetical protein
MTSARESVGIVPAKAAMSAQMSARATCWSTPGSESTVTTSWLAIAAVMHSKQL